MTEGIARVVVRSLALLAVWLAAAGVAAGEGGKPLVLQDMAWPDVQQYLKTNDMVIIPLGSTEQHGPHLPLGSDYYEATEMAKRVSARTGVIVAPVVLAGYSLYHTGFPGSLSLKPETMVQVLFETAEVLGRYGFRRIMFFNAHGGNRIVEAMAVHRINQTTGMFAVAIGESAPFPLRGPAPVGEVNDYHAGVDETSVMLFLRRDLVRMERAAKPVITNGPVVDELVALSREHPELQALGGATQTVPIETGKGGSLSEISSNGVWTNADPRTATAALGEAIVNRQVETSVAFIEAWKLAKAQPVARPAK